MALTKNDIVEQLQTELGFPKRKSIEITESLLEIIKAALESGDDVLASLSPKQGRRSGSGSDSL